MVFFPLNPIFLAISLFSLRQVLSRERLRLWTTLMKCIYYTRWRKSRNLQGSIYLFIFKPRALSILCKSCVSIPPPSSTPYPRDIFKTVKWTSSIAFSPNLDLYVDQADLKLHLLLQFPLCWDYWHAVMPSTNLSFDTFVKTFRGLSTVFLSPAEGRSEELRTWERGICLSVLKGPSPSTPMKKEYFVYSHNILLAFTCMYLIDVIYLLLLFYFGIWVHKMNTMLVKTRGGCGIHWSWSYWCSCHVGTGHLTQILRMSSKFSQQQSHLYSLFVIGLKIDLTL